MNDDKELDKELVKILETFGNHYYWEIESGWTAEHEANAKKCRPEAIAQLNHHYYQKFLELIDQTHDIYLTRTQVAEGDYGDDVAKHWDLLRARQRQQAKLKLLGSDDE